MSNESDAPGINTKEVFDGLVKNALSFLDKSLKAFEEDELQQSVINFATAIELILKARLLLEHWTLIIKKPEQAKISQFHDGTFISVPPSKSIDRLRQVVGLTIPKATETVFESIRNYRNTMVHFYHPGEGDAITKVTIAGQQLNGWGHLYILVAKYWRYEFADYYDRFESINTEMLKYKQFLNGKYEGLKEHIQKEISDCIIYKDCPSCSFHAMYLQESIPPLHIGTCRICPGWAEYLKVKCEKCDTINYLGWDWDGTICSNDKCKHLFEMENIVALYGNESPEHGYYTNGYCSECHYAHSGHTVVELDPKTLYLCLSCFETYYEMGQCGNCGDKIAGDNPWKESLGACFRCLDNVIEKEVNRENIHGFPRMRRHKL